MSYISTVESASLNASGYMSQEALLVRASSPLDTPPSDTSERLTAGLEITVLVSMLSGLSLALCIVAAGAF